MIDKETLIDQIIEQLTADLDLLTEAAKRAHDAATHEENIPEDKYDTQGLEASYIAQGQANRAQEIRKAIDTFRAMTLLDFDEEKPIRLSAFVTIVDEKGVERQLFLGPDAGGLKIDHNGDIVSVITPQAPLGRAILGCVVDDQVEIGAKTYDIIGVE